MTWTPQLGWASLALGLEIGGGECEEKPPPWQTLGTSKHPYHLSPASLVNEKKRHRVSAQNDTPGPGLQPLTHPDPPVPAVGLGAETGGPFK